MIGAFDGEQGSQGGIPGRRTAAPTDADRPIFRNALKLTKRMTLDAAQQRERHICGREVVREDLSQGRLVLRLNQRFDRTLW